MVYVAHLVAAIALFYLVNWIGKHAVGLGYMQLSVFARSDGAPAFNTLLRVCAPTVFILVLSTFYYSVGADDLVIGVWVVAPASYFFRVIYNIAIERGLLLNYSVLALQAAASTVLAYLAYKQLIIPRQPLFPDLQTIGNELWIIIIFFLYSIANSITFSSDGSVRRKKRYLLIRINHFKRQYGDIIEGAFDLRALELAVYAILVYESFNRPKLARYLENLSTIFGARTVGIMQVGSVGPMTDRQSVSRGIEKLAAEFAKAKAARNRWRNDYKRVERTIAAYNRDDLYVQEVLELMRVIAMQVLPEYQEDFEALGDIEVDLDDLRV